MILEVFSSLNNSMTQCCGRSLWQVAKIWEKHGGIKKFGGFFAVMERDSTGI